jgi:hypothetical protein
MLVKGRTAMDALHLQVGLLNHKPRPHEVEEFVLRHHAVAMLGQGHEEVKGARTQWHRQSVDPRFSRRRNDFYPTESVGATFRIAHDASILATDDRGQKPLMLVWGMLWMVRNRRHGRASTQSRATIPPLHTHALGGARRVFGPWADRRYDRVCAQWQHDPER